MQTYQNPVYRDYFADPFVWKHDGIYYAVGTGPIAHRERAGEGDFTSYRVDGGVRAFPLLRSENFVDWQLTGGALNVPEFAVGGAFWAPEVAYADGWFYLYYSVSTEGLHHQLRVAVSREPIGPYKDAGLLMRDADRCPFAIDAHPFQDEDGQWCLFYARDFLDTENGVRAGTALVVDRLVGMTRLAGNERVVLRAKHDWQRFQANRLMYGGRYDWHTLEGPCVRKHEGRYYCFYSGGCYENATYGVDYGVADHVMGPYSDKGNEQVARVLQTVPGRVIGPGHHSIAVGPDGVTEYIAYHAWDKDLTARRMFLDKLLWTEDGPRCQGPTWTKQVVVGANEMVNERA